MENIVKFDNVSFQYEENTPILKNLNLEIKKGKYTVLLGHNGCGKSTIAKLIIGLLEAQNGTITVNNLLLNEENIDKIRDKVALVFQNPDNQFIGSTVADDIAFGLENRCVPMKDMEPIIKEFAKKVGMIDFLNAEPTNLSGGQKQRVALAGALAVNASLLVLDEATSMLDPLGRKEIFSLIQELRKANPDMSIISITHQLNECLLADEIIIINKGEVIKTGAPKDILYDKKLLEDNFLQPPFVIQMQDALHQNGIDIEKCLSIEEMVDQL